VKGISLYGAVAELHKLGHLKNIHRFAGSSAGAIMATALACRMPLEKLETIIVGTDFKEFMDDNWGYVKDTYRLIHNFGWYKGDRLHEWMKETLSQHTGLPDITFKECYDLYRTELVVTGTNVNEAVTEYYHHTTTPDMPLSLAVRISASIPFFFQCVRRGDDILVDGGTLNNYPIWVFKPEGGLCKSMGDAEYNEKTLGLKMMSQDEKKDNIVIHKDDDIENIMEYTKSLMKCILIEVERAHIRKGYWKNTIAIPTFDVRATDFDLTDETKNKLIQSGEIATIDFFTTIDFKK